tara:strand:+ start:1721 stop:2047 length:327 start_codon:yes stop_codon:yes gene_type:complete
MASSIREKMAQQEKAKKIAQREIEIAAQEREKSEDNKQQHSQTKVGGASAKASGGNSTGAVKKVRARTKKGHYKKDDPNTPENEAWVEEKPKEEKAPAKKRGRPRKKV